MRDKIRNMAKIEMKNNKLKAEEEIHPSSLILHRLKEVTIVCDGSSLGNGRETTRAAAAAVLGFRGYWKAVGEYLGHATNQQAEIAAATVGLKSLNEPCKVTVITDSRYVVQTMLGNFRKKTNLDWWEKLEKAARKHDIKWEWTKGHDGHEIQEIADKMAKMIATMGRVDAVMLEDAVVDIGVTRAPQRTR